MQDNNDAYDQILSPKYPAEWERWKHAKQIKLWQAVALACDIEPSQITVMGSEELDRFFNQLPRQFEDLLLMAKNNLGGPSILKPIQINFDNIEETEIAPSNFGSWLKSIHYSFPAEFPWQDEPVLPLTRDWPWGTYETDLLKKLALAANRFWRNYDPTDPTTAPTNNDVVNWLINEHGVAIRNARFIATILRADGLPTGPRK